MAATERIRKATVFEQEIYELLQSDCTVKAVAVNGSESTHDPQFMDLIRSNRDPGALLLRFAPDGVILTTDERVWYWDAKASDQIERDAYETYMFYIGFGCKIMLFCRSKRDGNIYRQHVDRLQFMDSTDWVNRFPCPFPVRDGWICPRIDNSYTTNDVFSGTPYSVLDLDSMVIYCPQKIPKKVLDFPTERGIIE